VAKVRELKNIDPETGAQFHHRQFLYWCLGCGYEHAFALTTEGGHHEFNMDLKNPTISPSLLYNFNPEKICHSFIKEGKIEYLNDCWHHMKGQTVELPDVDELIEQRKQRFIEQRKSNNS
jgi:hypothetical protein